MTNTSIEPAPEFSQKKPLLRRVFGSLPTLVVLAALVAVGIWGHRTGWKAPKFAEVFPSGANTGKEDWCLQHNVPDSQCIACHPELAGESAVDWCKEHGVPESRCTICHPEILATGVAADWCKDHGVPESCCTLCHPEIARKGELPPGEYEVQGSEPDTTSAGTATPGKNPATCQKHALKVQFASKEAVAKAGVRLGAAIERPMAEAVAVPAEVGYDRTRFAKVVSRVSGTARYLGKELGAMVDAGDVMAVIDAAEIGRTKAEFLQAFAAREVAIATEKRFERSASSGFRTEVERSQASAMAREAEIRLFNARQAMLNLGFPLPDGAPTPDAIATLGIPETVLTAAPELSRSANLQPIVAPLGGVIVMRDLTRGESVDTTRVLFEVADLRRMWVTMDVPQSLSARIAVGARILFRPDHSRDEPVAGRIEWISTAVDEVTRTLKVRATVDNETGRLRANTFGKAQIVIRPTARAITVPDEALQWEGCCHVVFVRLADTVFQTRKVRIGASDGAYTEVLVGVLPGEVVATTGSHVLTSEILKSNLGAGCCDSR